MDEPAGGPPARSSPYQGLIPYAEADAAWFFGRDRERQRIIANLLASRITLLYGESGVGKTSVLRAGVIHDLQREARAAVAAGDRPEQLVVELASWADDPVAALADAIDGAARTVYGDAAPPRPEAATLPDLVAAWTKRLETPLLLILDQFEECLLYHGDERGPASFVEQFPAVVKDRSLDVNVLVAIRADAMSRLDAFKGRIPNLLDNRLALAHLSRDAAREAITAPLAEFNRRSGAPARSIEPALVDQVLHEVAHGQVVVGAPGQGGLGRAVDERRIETPYLQLVMSRLWDEEADAGSAVLRTATLDRLGGAARIVRTHLDDALRAWPPPDLDVAAAVFRFLVTPGGTKIALSAADLAEFTTRPVSDVERVLHRLADVDRSAQPRRSARILRSVEPPLGRQDVRYEIFHDVLGPAIVDWRRRHDEQRRRAAVEEEIRRDAERRVAAFRRRVRRIALLAVAVVAVAAGGLTLQAYLARQESERLAAAATRTVAASELHVATALTALDSDPQAGLHHALRAWNTLAAGGLPPSESAERAIRLALSRSRLRAVLDVGSPIVAAAYRPDGSAVALGAADGTALLAGADGSRQVALEGHSDRISGIRFAPDGARVVTAGRDGTVRVWDANTGELVHRLDHDGQPAGLATTDAFAADGAYVAIGAFSGDGRYLVTSAGSAGWLWDLAAGSLVRKLEDPEERHAVSTASFAPEGDRILTAGAGGVVLLWQIDDPSAPPTKLETGTSVIEVASFDPTGDLIVLGSDDGTLHVLDAHTGEEVARRADHVGRILSLAFAPDTPRLVTAAAESAAVIGTEPPVTPGGTRRVATLDVHAPYTGVAFTADGRAVVTANQDGSAHVLDTETGTELFALRGHQGVVATAAVAPDASVLVTGSEDGTARFWDIGVGVRILHTRAVNTVEFSPDGRRIVSAEFDEQATVSTMTGETVAILQGRERGGGAVFAMESATYLPDGDRILTAQDDGTISVWDGRTHRLIRECCVLYVPDQARVASAMGVPGQPDLVLVRYDTPSSVVVWRSDAAAEQQLFTFGGDDEPIQGYAVSDDGGAVATVGRTDNLVRIWRPDWTGGRMTERSRWTTTLVTSLAFSPDGSVLALGGVDGLVRVWDVASGQELQHPDGREMRVAIGAVTAVAFSADGSQVLGGQADGVVRIWDWQARKLLGDLQVHAGSITDIDTFADGRIATASDDRSATVTACPICVPIDELVDLAAQRAAIFDPLQPRP